jgi:hypothetical protein
MRHGTRLRLVKPKMRLGPIVEQYLIRIFRYVITAMDSQITHPTKEQVRAYMSRREAERRPPPPPAEIRRQLGWRIAPADPVPAVVQLYLLPSTVGQLGVQLVFDWIFCSSRAFAAARSAK